jgi:SAM-dependent methyltransferase
METKTKGHGNGHSWIAGIIGLAAAIFLFIKMPGNRILTGTVFLFATAHLLAALLFLASAYLVVPQSWFQKSLMKTYSNKLYFGWSYGWMNLFGLFFLILFISAIFVYFTDKKLAWLSFLLLLGSFQLFAGYISITLSKKLDYMTLPFVDLLSSDKDLILDAGCGGGRTTVALSKVMKNSRIVALDRFDSNYIKDGGRAVLERNLSIAGIIDKVDICQGDITGLSFKDEHFDSAISSYMMDHLGKYKFQALREIDRVLKPGARFLLIVFVPNWFTFSIFSLFSRVLSTRKGWRSMFPEAGLQLIEEGAINGGVYFLLQKKAKL